MDPVLVSLSLSGSSGRAAKCEDFNHIESIGKKNVPCTNRESSKAEIVDQRRQQTSGSHKSLPMGLLSHRTRSKHAKRVCFRRVTNALVH